MTTTFVYIIYILIKEVLTGLLFFVIYIDVNLILVIKIKVELFLKIFFILFL